jgi:hypothetical protein
MKRIAMLLAGAALVASSGLPFPAEAEAAAQSAVKPKSAASHKVPMHPHTLTLYPHGRPKPRQPAHSFTRHRFDHPTPINNTFMGARYY